MLTFRIHYSIGKLFYTDIFTAIIYSTIICEYTFNFDYQNLRVTKNIIRLIDKKETKH